MSDAPISIERIVHIGAEASKRLAQNILQHNPLPFAHAILLLSTHYTLEYPGAFSTLVPRSEDQRCQQGKNRVRLGTFEKAWWQKGRERLSAIGTIHPPATPLLFRRFQIASVEGTSSRGLSPRPHQRIVVQLLSKRLAASLFPPHEPLPPSLHPPLRSPLTMADAPADTYVVDGYKITPEALRIFSSLLSPEASDILQRTQGVITILQVRTTLTSCPMLRLSHSLVHPKQSR